MRTCLFAGIAISLLFLGENSGISLAAAGSSGVSEKLIQLTEAQQRSGLVRVMTVEKKSMETELRRTGTLNFDEEKVSIVSARVAGREVRVLAFEGQKVKKDDPLALIYSPDYTTAEVELLNAFKVARTLSEQAESGAYITAAERKLRLMGASKGDIDEITRTKNVSRYLTLHAPRSGVILNSALRAGLFMNPGDQLMTIADLSRLLVYMDIYEGDFPLVRTGQRVLLESVAYPDRVFPGKIVYLGGMVDPITRTFHVRAEIPNPDRLLKPGMFASVRIRLSVPRPVVALPEVAVLRDEHGYHAFVEKKPGVFEYRRVVTGQEEHGWIRIESGLVPGERVAVKGALLLEGIRETNLSEATGRSDPLGRIGRPRP
ncbi:MAG: efflux RND transporter periplasmic adaptor subunit [Nitrospirae bacterium]|nr:efflux RND transporter periplasmic adaptor subunit [Nitrospirota bacterium]MCL5286096.1 efflux RND transporter periplasmic adaptor subunit [Nitrospirota bacterium]